MNTNGEAETSKAMKSLEELVRKMSPSINVDPDKAVHIFRLLVSADNKGLSDEDIEKRTGYKQSEIRRVLRLLYENSLAVYRRGRHPETGATRHYWRIDWDNVKIAILRRKKMVLAKLKYRLQYEKENTFYVCPVEGFRYTFNEAFDYDFTCPRCGSLLEEEDNTHIIRFLEKRIKELEEEIARDEAKIFNR